MSSETISTLLGRVSVRRYADRAVPEELVDEVLQAAFRAPTSSNIQAYSVIRVREPRHRQTLAQACGNQAHIEQCPVFLAFCADINRLDHALQINGHDLSDNNLETGLVASIDAALVGMSAYLAAQSVGLAGVMIGAVRNDPRTVAQVLGLRGRIYCVFGMCLGYPDEKPVLKPRMNTTAMVHEEHYDRDAAVAEVEHYDAALAAHYRSQGRNTDDASWSRGMSDRFSSRPRDSLRDDLASLGFDFL